MKALKDKRVQLSIVGLIVAAAAAYGVAVDEQALLAVVVALLAAVAGGLAGRVASVAEVAEHQSARALEVLDEMSIAGARVHNQAMDEPFVYPDSIAISDQPYDLVEMAEDVAILSRRVTALEQQLIRLQSDS